MSLPPRTSSIPEKNGALLTATVTLSPEQERKLWRKIDVRLLVIITLMYLFSFMDRGNIGNAKLEGLVTQLHLTGNQFNIALGPRYSQLTAVRFCLGVAEAGFVPGVAFFLSMWYPKYKVLYRLALFAGAAGAAGAFSGLFAYAIGFMNNVGGLQGWAWIFTVFPDYPATAKFLSPEEKQFVDHQRAIGIEDEEKGTVIHGVLSAFTDWQVWALTIITTSIFTAVYGMAFFLPTILNNVPVSQLLTVPIYIAANKMKMRWPFLFSLQVTALIGYIIEVTDAPMSVKYFGTFLCAVGSYSAGPVSVGWLANNLDGKYKRAVGLALQIGTANLGGIAASNIYRAQDEPRFILGHATEIAFLSVGLLATIVTAYTYQSLNTTRVARAKSEGKGETDEHAIGLYVI
ncbi:hypothetical protein ID866_8855 [Astraeus odoratus]|nr:hypothetical protein ID866_8855 [Astraeus odoratus]